MAAPKTKFTREFVEDAIRTTAYGLFQAAVERGELPVGMNDCDAYGMTFGCDGRCPVFIAGDCKCVDEDPEGFRKVIKETDRFSDWEISELNDVYPQLKLQE